ncbi:MAG: hypothetical protein ACPGSB_09190, partial [Opitutales bacterium]
MSRKQLILRLSLPVIGALLLFGWVIGLPLAGSIVMGEISDFFGTLKFVQVYIRMFGIPAWVWVTVAFACFGAGLRLVLRAAHRPEFAGAQVLGLILSMAPLCV